MELSVDNIFEGLNFFTSAESSYINSASSQKVHSVNKGILSV